MSPGMSHTAQQVAKPHGASAYGEAVEVPNANSWQGGYPAMASICVDAFDADVSVAAVMMIPDVTTNTNRVRARSILIAAFPSQPRALSHASSSLYRSTLLLSSPCPCGSPCSSHPLFALLMLLRVQRSLAVARAYRFYLNGLRCCSEGYNPCLLPCLYDRPD
jgi:hypothetical protein